MGRRVTQGVCVALVGSLGAGKSVLARSVSLGLGVREEVVSPTFILCEEYPGRLPVVHIDLYRLDHECQLEELGVLDKLGSDAVLLVEWGDRSERIMNASDIVIKIGITGEETRGIEVMCTPGLAGLFGE